MKRYCISLLSLFVALTIVSGLLLPSVSAYSDDNLIYEDLSLVSDGEISETGYLSEKWVNSDGKTVEVAPSDSSKPVSDKSSVLPSSYNSVSESCVTSVKNQESTNVCWAFSAAAVAESSLLKNCKSVLSASYPDLSEAHLVWFTHKSLSSNEDDPTYGDGTYISNPYSSGGYWLRSTFALARGSGFALESDYPFFGNNVSMMGNYSESSRYDSVYSLDSAYLIPNTETDEIKKVIMKQGAISAAAYISTQYLNKGEDGCAYFQNTRYSTNHQMTIVGWDDDFSVDNFKDGLKPDSPGAWLVKNSYGVTFGDNGYFWISYCEPSLSQFAAEEVSVKDKDETVYQYDGYGYSTARYANTSAGTPVNTASQANVFTPQKAEIINAVSFYTMQDDVDYKIEIFTNVTPNMSSPTAGKSTADYVMSGKVAYQGYHKISLKSGVPVNKGESFSVVITFSVSDERNVYVLFEGENGKNDGIYTRYYSSKSGQSYFKYANNSWIESSGNNNLNNVCIKAFTKPDNSLVINSAQEFNEFAKKVSNGNSFDGKNVSLGSDIDFDGKEIIPVGTHENPFCGNFFGNGYVISNGYINSDKSYVGVFSEISENSSVTKLGVEKVEVTGENSVGVLCGNNKGSLKHCYTIGSVTGKMSVGGLVGTNSGSISYCYSLAEVSGETNAGLLAGEDDSSGKYEMCFINEAFTSVNPIGNAYSDEILALPKKSFENGQVAFLLDNGNSSRYKIWTQRDGVTTFSKSDDEIVYQIEIYFPADYSSLFLYVTPKDDLYEKALEGKTGCDLKIYADSKLKVPFNSVLSANMILYGVWEQTHKCADEIVLVEGTPADCYNEGRIDYYKCTCGKIYKDEKAETEISLTDTVINALSHPAESVTKTDATEPSCTSSGNIEYYTCTLCNDRFSDKECTIKVDDVTIPPSEHDYAKKIVQPTKTSCGYIVYNCKNCTATYTDDYVDYAEDAVLKGNVTSFLSESDTVSIELIRCGEAKVLYSLELVGNNVSYKFENITSGFYVVRISKNNHTTRECLVAVGNSAENTDFKINPIGDIDGNGRITVSDYVTALRCAKATLKLDEYEFLCADVDSNGKITVSDYVKILSHVKGMYSLWL